MNVDDAIEELADADLLTERQAEAFVLRDVEAVPREAAAESMEISKNTLDNILSAARSKVENAQQTAAAVEAIRHEEIPIECFECGDALGGPWTRNENGMPVCLECGGIEPGSDEVAKELYERGREQGKKDLDQVHENNRPGDGQ